MKQLSTIIAFKKRKILEKKMQEDSYAVREESMRVLKEFDDIDDED